MKPHFGFINRSNVCPDETWMAAIWVMLLFVPKMTKHIILKQQINTCFYFREHKDAANNIILTKRLIKNKLQSLCPQPRRFESRLGLHFYGLYYLQVSQIMRL